MARFVHKADSNTSISGNELNDSMAFIYGNLINYSLDGLGSLGHQNIYTDAITSDNATTKTGWDYGTGSYETGSGTGSMTCTLIFPVVPIGNAATNRELGSALELFYTFDSYNSTTLFDSIGSHDGIINNVEMGVSGKNGFAGSFSTGSISTNLEIPQTGGTLSCWIKSDATLSSTRCLFGSNNSADIYIATVSANTLYVQGLNDSSASYTLPESMSVGSWYNLLVTRESNGDTRVYLNNVESSTGAHTITGSLNFNQVGRYSNNDSLYWKGCFDNIGLWRRILSSDEKGSLYNSGNGLSFPFNTNTGIVNTFVPRIIGSQADTSIGSIFISMDNGTTYTKINDMSMGTVSDFYNTGSLVFKYELVRSDDSTKDVLNSFGVYYG